MAAKGIAAVVVGASAGALATVAGYYMVGKIKQLFARKPKMKLFNNQLLLSTRCTWFISELGTESDFELIDDDDMPMYPGETCPDDEEHAFQLVEYKKEKTADDSRSLCSNDSDFDDYDDRIGLVPALVVNDDFSMIEGAAIRMYLADMYGQFQPPPDRKAEYYSWIVYSAATFDGIVKTLHTQLHDQPASRRNDALVESATQAFRAFARALTDTLSSSEYLCGNTFTTADCVLGFTLWWAYTLERGALFDDFPVLLAYFQRLRERPAFQITFGKEDTKWDWSNYFTKYMRAIKR